jgi:hypothetical protein
MLGATSVAAQTNDTTPFVPERPGVSTPPEVLASGKFQLENGFQYTNFFTGAVHNENYLFSSLLLRYGLVKRVELRLQTDFAYNIAKDSTGNNMVYGLTPQPSRLKSI